jgi:hypothetical protein
MTAPAAKGPGGINVEVTRPDKLFFPDDGIGARRAEAAPDLIDSDKRFDVIAS